MACALVRAASRLVGMLGGHPQVRRFSARRPEESGRGTHECVRHFGIAGFFTASHTRGSVCGEVCEPAPEGPVAAQPTCYDQILEMDDDGLKSTLRSMREDWDHRARENARHYVATRQAAWTDEEFFASGEKEVADEILSDMANICQERQPASMRVLEIGCGAGRVTRALARLFGEVHAVDVSGEMVAQARAALSGHANAFVYQNNGMDLSVVPDLPFDFAFSVIVFQHIPSRDVIESYFREVARLLRPGALFKVQVLGCPPVPRPAPVTSEIPRPLVEAVAAAHPPALRLSHRNRPSIRRIPGWASCSPRGMRRPSATSAASNCAISAARASRSTGCGASRSEAVYRGATT